MLGMILYILALLALCVPTFGATEEELEDLLLRMRRLEAPERKDRGIVEPLMERVRSSRGILPILEQNVIYWYLKATNTRAEKFASPVDSNWKIYRRRSEKGFAMVVENFDPVGAVVHELEPLRIQDSMGSFTWHPTRLEVYFTDQREEHLRVLHYVVDGGKMEVEVSSGDGDFSPAMAPDGGWLAWLSSRDKTSSRDLRTSIYVKRPGSLDEFRVLGLGNYIANKPGEEPGLKFVEPDILEARMASGETTSVRVSQAVAEDKKRRETQSRPQVLIPNLPSEGPRPDFTFRVEDSLPFGEGVFKVLKVSGKIRIEYQPGPNQRELLSEGSFEEWEAHPGKPYVLYEDRAWYVRFENGSREIWYAFPFKKKKGRFSPRLEDCFCPVISSDGRYVAFLLKRLDTLFAVIADAENSEQIETVELKGLPSVLAEAPIRFIGEEFQALNRLGDWRTLDLETPLYAPREKVVSLPRVSRKPEKPNPELTLARTEFSDTRIQGLIAAFPDWIREVRSLEDVHSLKWRFNLLHEQIRMRREKIQNPEEKTPDVRLLGIWIRKMNAIHTLLDNAQILMELEEE